MHAGRAFGIVFSVIGLVWITGFITCQVRAEYEYETKISSNWSLADKASTIKQKSEYIDKFVKALEDQHLEGQHSAIIFPTPNNSFDENFKALKSLQERLEEIQVMDPKSFEYQSAIQQITAQEQGEAHRMLIIFYDCWLKQNHIMLWSWVAGISVMLFVLVTATGLMMWAVFDDRHRF